MYQHNCVSPSQDTTPFMHAHPPCLPTPPSPYLEGRHLLPAVVSRAEVGPLWELLRHFKHAFLAVEDQGPEEQGDDEHEEAHDEEGGDGGDERLVENGVPLRVPPELEDAHDAEQAEEAEEDEVGAKTVDEEVGVEGDDGAAGFYVLGGWF